MRLVLAALALLGPLAAQAEKRVVMETFKGRVVIALEELKAPYTVRNFLAYVNSRFYDNTLFHRVIPDFMIQGGGMTLNHKGGLQEKTTSLPPVRNEADNGLRNLRGTLAMARGRDPHYARAQFVINTTNKPSLDFRGKNEDEWGYAVFGRVIKGMDVVDRISATPTDARLVGPFKMTDIPVMPVYISSIREI